MTTSVYCMRCLLPHDEVNPHTGRPYTRCATCRPLANAVHIAWDEKRRAARKLAGQRPKSPAPRHVPTGHLLEHDPISAAYFWRQAVRR